MENVDLTENRRNAENDMREHKSFFDTPGWLVISGAIIVSGAACTVLSVIFQPQDNAFAWYLTGAIFLAGGLISIIVYALRLNKKSSLQETVLKDKLSGMQQRINKLQTEREITQKNVERMSRVNDKNTTKRKSARASGTTEAEIIQPNEGDPESHK